MAWSLCERNECSVCRRNWKPNFLFQSPRAVCLALPSIFDEYKKRLKGKESSWCIRNAWAMLFNSSTFSIFRLLRLCCSVSCIPQAHIDISALREGCVRRSKRDQPRNNSRLCILFFSSHLFTKMYAVLVRPIRYIQCSNILYCCVWMVAVLSCNDQIKEHKNEKKKHIMEVVKRCSSRFILRCCCLHVLQMKG